MGPWRATRASAVRSMPIRTPNGVSPARARLSCGRRSCRCPGGSPPTASPAPMTGRSGTPRNGSSTVPTMARPGRSWTPATRASRLNRAGRHRRFRSRTCRNSCCTGSPSCRRPGQPTSRLPKYRSTASISCRLSDCSFPRPAATATGRQLATRMSRAPGTRTTGRNGAWNLRRKPSNGRRIFRSRPW
ncbi:hypothetical protein D3C87_1362290 [compost metagenome]